MASPTPAAFATTDISTATTSHVLNLPTGASAGDRIVFAVGFPTDPGTITPPTGMAVQRELDQPAGGTAFLYVMVYEKQASEATCTLTTANSVKSATAAARITGDSTSIDAEITTGAIGANGPPNPDTSTPTGGSKDYLFIACGTMGGETAITAAPTNYTNLQEADTGTAGAVTANARTAIATRQLTAASDDPGAFTGGDATQEWVGMTVAFHPAGAAAQSVSPAALSMTLAPVAPSLLQAQLVSPAALSMTLVAVAPRIAQPGLTEDGHWGYALTESGELVLGPVTEFGHRFVAVAPGAGAQSVSPAALSMALAPVAPTVTQQVLPAALSMTLAPVAPTIARSVAVPALSMTLAPVAPTIAQSVSPPALAMTLAPVAPAITQQVLPGALAMTLTPVAPVVSQAGAPQSVSPAALSMTLAPVAPVVAQVGITEDGHWAFRLTEDGHHVVGVLTENAHRVVIPVAAATDVVFPPALSMTLTPVAPAIVTSQQVSPAALAMTLVPVAPAQVAQQVRLGLSDIYGDEPTELSMTLVPVAPTISQGAGQSVSPAALSMTLVPVSPAQLQQQVRVTALSMLLAPVAPTVSLAGPSVTPAALSMLLVPVAPIKLNQSVRMLVLSMSLTPIAPVVSSTFRSPEPALSSVGADRRRPLGREYVGRIRRRRVMV